MVFDFDNKPSDSPLVDFVWKSRTEEGGGSFISTAAYQSELVVTKQFDKITLSIRGPETQASSVGIPEDAEIFGIVLKLGTYMPKLPPINLLNNNTVHLQESAYNSIWLGSAWQIPTYENADVFISRLIREGLLVYDPLVNSVIKNRPLEMSIRTIQRRFLVATGVSHKTIQQIDRAKEAARLLEQGRSILDTTYELGYFDHAHMTKSLKHYFGVNPRELKPKP